MSHITQMPDTSAQLPALVVGGGIAGLAAALALSQQGQAVQLLEQADQIGTIGYGVQIGPNIAPMMEKLGIADAVKKASYLPEQILLYEAYTGDRLAHIPLRTPEFHARYQQLPYIAIHRVDLHEILLAACKQQPHIALSQSTTVVDYSAEQDHVKVVTEQGEAIYGKGLIAADGLRSKLRSRLNPSDAPRDTGYVAHRTIIPMKDAPASLQKRQGVTMWTGDGFHVIYYPLRNATELNLVLVVRLPEGVHNISDEAYKVHIDELMQQVTPEARDAMALMNLERRWAIADRTPIRHWSQGRMTLLGDSAHATLQSLAQGAGMAFEDALVLSELVKKHGDDFSSAFKELQRLRFLRTSRVQLESRALWDVYHCAGVDAEVRTQQFKEKTPEDFYRCLDWLWQPISLSV